MGDDNREQLMESGVDCDSVVERFVGRWDLYLKLAKKFPYDSSYQKMLEAIDHKDVDAAFRYAHTLKGLCANLSFAKLQQECSILVECLRSGSLAGISEPLERVNQTYQQLITVLNHL